MFAFVAIIIGGPLQCAYSKYFLERSRGNISHDNLNVCVDDAKVEFVDKMVLGLLINLFVFLWSLLLIIPGIIASYSYSMAYYIKCDHPEYDHKRCREESKKMMNGRKMDLFLLDLSFIGWIFVGILTLGIGLLWVQPYMDATRVEFYREIISDQEFVANEVKEEQPFESVNE